MIGETGKWGVPTVPKWLFGILFATCGCFYHLTWRGFQPVFLVCEYGGFDIRCVTGP